MRRFIGFCIILIVLANLSAADDLEKMNDIKKLLELTGAMKVGAQMSDAVMSQLSTTIKGLQTNLPDTVIEIVATEVRELIHESLSRPGGLTDIVCALYDKYFTGDEIKEILRFYETPLGKKMIELMPTIVQESMIASQDWVKSTAPILDAKIKQSLADHGITAP